MCRAMTCLLAALLLLASLVNGQGWMTARSTFYGGPPRFTKVFDVNRGIGSFGVLEYGSCGYTNTLPGKKGADINDVPFPRGAVAAISDQNPDYPGSCGRCYEVRCKPGTVIGYKNKPVPLSNFTVLEDINRSVKDSFGRSFPGNAGKPKGQQVVKCWGKKSIVVNIIDSCPCRYKVKQPNGKFKTIIQSWCCGDQKHFDLSYWAFEQLAHPVYGVMMVQFRPVDCDNPKRVLPYLPGKVSSVIFSDRMMTGWNWFAYGQQYAIFSKPKAGITNSKGVATAATCVSVAQNGALSVQCRQCMTPGYQPFKGKKGITFWIRSDTQSSNVFASSTPKGKIPALKLFTMRDPADSNSNYKDKITAYCNKSPILGKTIRPIAARPGGWYRFAIPLSAFDCQGLASWEFINRLDFQNVQLRNAQFCLDEIKLY